MFDDIPTVIPLGLQHIDETIDIDAALTERKEQAVDHRLAEGQTAGANQLRKALVEIFEVDVNYPTGSGLGDDDGIGPGKRQMSGVDA